MYLANRANRVEIARALILERACHMVVLLKNRRATGRNALFQHPSVATLFEGIIKLFPSPVLADILSRWERG